jgi:hypothetical protein
VAKIVKKITKVRDPEYRRRKAALRELDQFAANDELLERSRILADKYDTDIRRGKYAKYFEKSDGVDPNYRKVFRKKFLSSKRLRFNATGELTRESGRFGTKREVLKRDAESGEEYLGRFEKESWRQKAGKPRKAQSWTRDKNGKILSGYKTRADGRFDERWELDEKGNPIRTKYFTKRKRDGRFFRSISEEMSGPYESGLNKRKYRTLTRKKGSNEKVYERDDDGNLELIARRRLGYSWASRKSKDRKTSTNSNEHLWGLFSKSYQLLLDENGNELARDIRARRRFLSKRSAVFDERTRLQTSSQHKVGKFLYKNDTDFHITKGTKTVTRKILGLKVFGTKTVFLDPSEIAGQELREEEAAEHDQHWKDVAERIKTEVAARQAAGSAVHPVPAPGATKQLGGAHPGVDLSKPQPPPTFSNSTTAVDPGSKANSIGGGAPSPVLAQAGSEASSMAPSSNVNRILAKLVSVGGAAPPAIPPADPEKRRNALRAAVQQRDAADGLPVVKAQPAASATAPADPVKRLNILRAAVQQRDAANGSATNPPPAPSTSAPSGRAGSLSVLAASAARRDARPGEHERSARSS